MMRHFAWMMAVLAAGVFGTSADAQQRRGENLALVIGNFDYDTMQDVDGEQDADRMTRALRDAGFRVVKGYDLDAARQVGVARIFAERLDRADRVMVVMLGHVVSSGDDSFLLGVDTREADVLNAGRRGLSLAAVQSLIASKPGTAILMVAGNRAEPDLGRGLRDGFRPRGVQQGVTVVRGRAQELSQVLIDGLLEPGNSLRQALPNRAGLSVSGFVSDRVSFMGAGRGDEVDPDLGQLAYWNATRDIGTKEAYEAYLKRFPNGIFAGEAREALDEIREAPIREARAAEEALNLSREDRRAVQSVLTDLGFNTRGIDGVFGRGTRAAIRAWQESRGLVATGFLTDTQYRGLRREYDERRAAAEAAAEREAERQAERDRQAWIAARDAGSRGALRAYIRDFPNGRFVEQARARLAEIRRQEQDSDQGAAGGGSSDPDQGEFNNRRLLAEERIFAPNQVIRLAVERQLARNGFNPGPIDGNITTRTRRAIVRFQRSRGLPETGYLNAATISLLAL